jgi:2-methylcitrate dehydratase PrpD
MLHQPLSLGVLARFRLRCLDTASFGCALVKKAHHSKDLNSPTHKRTEGRAQVWGSEFTLKRRRTTGGIQQKPL